MKRISSLLLALLLALSLAGCNQPSAPTTTPAATEPVVWYDQNTVSITAQQVDSIVNGQFEKPKNVILLIGDGMGANDIALCREFGEENFDFGLVLDRIPHQGLATTHSASDEITDSAAAGTALATGTKTNNDYVGILPDGTRLKNLSEIAREHGKKVGIITDDAITGATPSAFLAHNESRDNEDEIYEEVLRFAPDVYIGKGDTARYNRALELGFNAATRFQQTEYTFSQADDRTKPIVTFNNGYRMTVSDELSQCTQLALNLLDNEKGFFLMVESSGTDKYGHSQKIAGKIASVTTLDRTLAAILLFMEQHPDTLLVVTSDHETGGVQLPNDGEQPGDHLFTTDYHTATPVKVFAVGQGSEYFADKTVDNPDIAKFLIAAVEE